MSHEIAMRILEHFRQGGTLDDSRIAVLYRVAHGLAAETRTEAPVVAQWALNAATHLPLNGAGRHEMALPKPTP